jgi:peptidoglycan hydrolase CwlO-like protein
MTTLGKILAFVVLVFAVLTAALEVMVYVTRTNWKDGFTKMEASLKAAQADSTALRAELKDVTDQANAKVQTISAEVARLTDELTRARAEIDKAQQQIEDARKNVDQADILKKETVAAQERLQKEVEGLQTVLAARDKELIKVRDDFRVAESKRVQSQIEVDSLKGRLENLTGELENLARDNERLRSRAAGATATVSGNGTATSNGSSAVAKNPPGDYVRGLVTAADGDTGLVTVSLGSDAGLSVNNTLEVYRLKPEPLYLGTIKIIDVRHHDAVGRALNSQKRQLIRVGDEVASDILGPR